MWRRRQAVSWTFIWALATLGLPPNVVGLVGVRRPFSKAFRSRNQHDGNRLRAQSSTTQAEEQARTMSVRELKQELEALNISTRDILEKKELVARYLEARQHQNTQQNGSESSGRGTSESSSASDCITAPLYLTSLQQGSQISGANIQGGITIASGTYYPALKLIINGKTVPLLLDTACTGILIKPKVVQDCQLRTISTQVSLTSAGGPSSTSSVSKVAQLQRFQLGEHVFGSDVKNQKSYSAVVQELDVLAGSALDGIIGLSFLQEFAAVDLDFQSGTIALYPTRASPLVQHAVLATCAMKRLPAQVGGLFYIPVLLGGRGPVNMLVDSGASSTILSWKGLQDLGLDRSGAAVQRVASATGSLGLDKVVTDLSHRIHVSSNLTLAGDDQSPGVSLAGTCRLAIDIGPIPLLEALASQGIGGILGIDAILRSAVCRLTFQGNPTITFYQQKL